MISEPGLLATAARPRLDRFKLLLRVAKLARGALRRQSRCRLGAALPDLQRIHRAALRRQQTLRSQLKVSICSGARTSCHLGATTRLPTA